MLSFSGVWLFTAFLAHLDGLLCPQSNVQPTMRASASSTSALPLPGFQWGPFFPQSLCDSRNEKADYASLRFAGQKSRPGQEQAGWGPIGRMSLNFSLFLSHHIQIVTEWSQFYLSSLHSGKEPKPHDDQTVFNFHVAPMWFPSSTIESCLQQW